MEDAFDTAHTRYLRNLEAIEAKVGPEVLRRDVTVNAYARVHAQRENFDLADCLAEIVKGLADGKDRITKIATELIERHGVAR